MNSTTYNVLAWTGNNSSWHRFHTTEKSTLVCEFELVSSSWSILIVRVLLHQFAFEFFGFFPVRQLLIFCHCFPSVAQTFAQLSIVQPRLSLSKSFSLYRGPDHKCIHRSLDSFGLVVFALRLASLAVCCRSVLNFFFMIYHLVFYPHSNCQLVAGRRRTLLHLLH